VIDLEGAGPPYLDAAATALLDAVLRDTGPGATAYDVMVALVVSRDPSVMPILPMDPRDLDRASDLLTAGRTDPAARALLATPARDMGEGARAQARYMGSPAATLRHLVLAVFALLPESGMLPHLRRMVADLEFEEHPEPGAPRGWVAFAPPDSAHMARPEELEPLREEMRRLRAEQGYPEPIDIEDEGELRGVVAIGAVARRDPVRLELIALEIRTSHMTLSWRLWVAGSDGLAPLPELELIDDLGTPYRAEAIANGWATDADGVRADGRLVVVPAIPPHASTLTLRMDRLALDPEEARFPGAVPVVINRPIAFAVDLTRTSLTET
jgi:hypothetical protein